MIILFEIVLFGLIGATTKLGLPETKQLRIFGYQEMKRFHGFVLQEMERLRIFGLQEMERLRVFQLQLLQEFVSFSLFLSLFLKQYEKKQLCHSDSANDPLKHL